MQLEDYFDFSYPDYIGIKGHRLGIHNVLNYFLSGASPEEIAAEYPGLSLEKIYATITYYLQKRSQIDAYLARLRREEETAYGEWRAKPAPPVVEKVLAIKQRRQQEMESSP
jgi:uncharacterized protein (DUF433 family)